MTTDHSPSLDEIRERALAAIECAVPGAEPRRWEAYFNRHGDPHVVPAGHLPNYQIAQVSTAPEDYGRALATYIAMMDPQTTLSLLSRIEYLEERERHWASVLGVADGGQYRNDWDSRIREVVARAERAEELVRVLGEALEEVKGRLEDLGYFDEDVDTALAATRAFTEANPTPGAEA